MKKKITVLALCFLLFGLSVSAHAQQPKKVARIGYLTASDAAVDSERSEGLRLALRDLGYIEGQNMAIEYRFGEGKQDRASELAAQLVRLQVDVIVVSAAELWIRAAKNATKTIPIVMAGQGPDPVKAGLIESLARPGGNVTGLTSLGRELGGKRLELLKEAVPKLARVAVLYDPAVPGPTREVKEVLPIAAPTLGLTISSWEVRDAAGFQKVFAVLLKQRPDGVYVPGGGQMFNANRRRIADLAIKSRLPSVHGIRAAVDAGGLVSYGADLTDISRQLAMYVDKILRGAKPADLPVQQPTKFELAINLKTAKQIGVTIPQSMLYRADRVIK